MAKKLIPLYNKLYFVADFGNIGVFRSCSVGVFTFDDTQGKFSLCRVGRSVLIVIQRYRRLITGWCSTFADMLASMHDICFLWLYPLGGG